MIRPIGPTSAGATRALGSPTGTTKRPTNFWLVMREIMERRFRWNLRQVLASVAETGRALETAGRPGSGAQGGKTCLHQWTPGGNASETQRSAQSANWTVEVGDRPTETTLDSERKTVTALFADIKGSTELMRDLDPEEARAIVDPVLHLMMEAVHRYGGYVAQSTGDGIFALFGAPVAHEDHPQRALHAALAMQRELRRYADRLRTEGKRRRANADNLPSCSAI